MTVSSHALEFYINGQWCAPAGSERLDVINPATETPCATIAMGNAQDVDKAVAAARAAFPAWSASSKEERIALLEKVIALYQSRSEEMAQAISLEMGSPIARARDSQAWSGYGHMQETLDALRAFSFDTVRDDMLLTHEAAGVAGLITPWNWPMNQIACKVAPALAAGCTMVLKPSEVAPLSALLFAEIMDEAGVPAGVFNMINGNGPEVGEALARHPDVDVMSITGSTRAGAAVARASADTIKRVLQELGGKSANIILPDADFQAAVSDGVRRCMGNSGQTCDAPTRMLVPQARMAEAMNVAQAVLSELRVGNPADETTEYGPVVSALQFERIQALIAKGIEEGATLVGGGTGKPAGLEVGYYVKPTVFGQVSPDMTISREEIFGPVLSIIGYADEEDAIRLANDTVYGLAAYVQSCDLAHARAVARRLRAGNVTLNQGAWTVKAPFGGYKQSGNGRECSVFGLLDFLELKAVIGYGEA
ncbi:aldehyde dehydrogenase family protein [Acetobacter suratthaniensis]|uniref:Aldehyde dehydrogenase family protein n=1 Tax=Acetobacter suratthaniensis TaxID=1502841 RepID=A0ABS3LKP3_9PROT|nr:aldehyde dehydrogenase family protein [Acetobacter suratthaniensis]MBO1328142.1 aldehyde dehydrogenase family protein [Acetobacter suratthaniensis]MCX2566262.1 aldehyde dehydrogenase family protein [Acetobacter suratthaniensis]